MDEHFRTTSLEKNIPFLMGVLGFWNNNINNLHSQAILPYCSGLEPFLKHIQQLEMESNGKIIDSANNITNYKTSPIVWGGIGTDIQHTFMQLLHQSNQKTPIDFIIPIKNYNYVSSTDKLNNLSAISQIQSLSQGNLISKNFTYCPGNHPITVISLNEVTPSVLGSLICSYEHKVYIQSLLWNINAFDQFGVEIGKQHLKNITTNLEKHKFSFQPLSECLIKYLQRFFL